MAVTGAYIYTHHDNIIIILRHSLDMAYSGGKTYFRVSLYIKETKRKSICKYESYMQRCNH